MSKPPTLLGRTAGARGTGSAVTGISAQGLAEADRKRRERTQRQHAAAGDRKREEARSTNAPDCEPYQVLGVGQGATQSEIKGATGR